MRMGEKIISQNMIEYNLINSVIIFPAVILDIIAYTFNNCGIILFRIFF
jgi:hypothetical protein